MASPPSQALATVTHPALQGGAELVERLQAAIRKRGFTLNARIDHAAAAQTSGLAMPTATVLLFGNPKNGTPLMLASPTLALELPLRILAWEDRNGMAFVSYTDPRSFAEHYALDGQAGVLDAMAATLESIASEAAESG